MNAFGNNIKIEKQIMKYGRFMGSLEEIFNWKGYGRLLWVVKWKIMFENKIII